MIRKGRARWVAKGDPLAQLQFIDELLGLMIWVGGLTVRPDACASQSFRNDNSRSYQAPNRSTLARKF